MSSQNTSRIIGPILRWFKPDMSLETIYRVQYMVRKTAHVTEYAVLAWLVWRAFQRTMGAQRGWNWFDAGVALLICAIYAMTDEWHQSLVPTRQGSWLDVGLDTAGAAAGLALIWWIGHRRHKW